MPVIAITGGIGSGKSTVREIFEELGAMGVDTDELAREVIEPGTVGSRKVREAFGETCFDREGRLDRKRLAMKIFRDTVARRKLESILHPLIRQAESRLIKKCIKKDPGRPVVVEIPLLAVGGRASGYDGVVLVTAPEKVRLQRLEKSGRYTRTEALARMRIQAPDSERASIAHWTVDNGGILEETKRQVEKIFHELTRK